MTSDIKTLKQLQEEHPEWCWNCGYPARANECQSPANPAIAALIAAKREDEARIAELDLRVAGYLRDASNLDTLLAEKDAQLTAEQQAHEETKRMLLKVCRSAHSFTIGKDELECLNNRLDNVWEAVEEADEYLGRQAPINRPTDKSLTNDRGEGEAK